MLNDEIKHKKINAILECCRTPKILKQIADETKSYEASYLRKIMKIMLDKDYVKADIVMIRFQARPIYTANVDYLTLDECVGVIDSIMKRHQQYLVGKPTVTGKRRDAIDTTPKKIVKGNSTIYSAEYLHHKRNENIKELKELGLYKPKRASYEINLQGSESII